MLKIKCPACRKAFRPARASQSSCSKACSAVVRERKRADVAQQRKGLEIAESNQWIEDSTKRNLPRHRWVSVASSGKPLSDLERGALHMSPPTDLFPVTGRAAAIKNAVEMELGCVVGDTAETLAESAA